MRHIPILFLLAFALSSCDKFLQQEPYNRISVDDIFQDFEGARTTLIGAYDNLKTTDYYERAIGIYADLTGGNIKYARSSNQAYLNTYNFANNSAVDQNDLTNFYQVAYNTIYRANNIFAYIEKVADATVPQKNRMLADAYVFRALAHFDLVRVFAQPYNFTAGATHPGIIIRTRNTGADAPVGDVAIVKAVYDQIIADLDSAVVRYSNSVPIYAGGEEKSYFSANFARALLVRVYLQTENWPKVIEHSNALIAAGYPLASNSNYVQGWRRNGNRAMDNEAICYLYARTDINQGAFGDNFNPFNTLFGYMAASNDLLNLFAPNDVRGRNTMFVQLSISGSPFFFTRKYQGRNDSADNQKLVRISEIYLARAEAQAESDNLPAALTDLNRIRQRAISGAPALVLTNKQELIDSILVERRRELCFEGQWLWDITRKKRNLVRTDCQGTNCSLSYPNPLFAVPRPTVR